MWWNNMIGYVDLGGWFVFFLFVVEPNSRNIIHWWHLNVPEISATKHYIDKFEVINEHGKQCHTNMLNTSLPIYNNKSSVHNNFQYNWDKNNNNYRVYDVTPEMLQFGLLVGCIGHWDYDRSHERQRPHKYIKYISILDIWQ